jgi:hypothetical protein
MMDKNTKTSEDVEILQEFKAALKDGRVEQRPSGEPGMVSLHFKDEEFEERWRQWNLRKELKKNGGKRTISRMSDDELKEFIIGWVRGSVFSTIHAGDRDWAMCFLPIKMGGILEPYLEEERPEPPEEPVKPEKPNLDALQEPVQPEPAVLIDPDEDVEVARLRNELEWGEPNSADLNHRLKVIEGTNQDLQISFDEKLAEYQKACEALEVRKAELLQKWESEMAEYPETLRAYEDAFYEFEERLESYKQKWIKSYDEQWVDLGLIWEWVDSRNALARGINGMPMFLSCRLMHIDDWKRAQKAIEAEQKRMENLQV